MNKIEVDTVVVGYLSTNCYIVSNTETKECVIIDPGENGNIISRYISEHGLNPVKVLITHHHPDHIGALKKIFENFGLTESEIEDEEEILGTVWKKLITPGHTKDSVEYFIEDEKILFSGDTLFYETFGRTDLEGGSLTELVDSMFNVVFKLPDDTSVFPGHGPQTTIGHEKLNNPLAVYIKRNKS